MAYCPDCSAEVSSRHVACPSCGRSLSDATVLGLPAQSPSGRNDITATTRQRLADLAIGWGLPMEKPPQPEPTPTATAPVGQAPPNEAAAHAEPSLPRRIPSGTLPMEAIKGTLPMPSPPPEAVLPVRQAKSVSTAEIDAMLGEP